MSHMPHRLPTRRHVLVAAAGLPLALAAGCSDDAGAAVPDLPFTQLDGSQHRLSDLQGKVALINFWATSCSTCVREMPEIVATHQRFKDRGYDTLAVAMQYDPPAYVMQFAQTRALPFRVAIDHSGELAQQMGPVQLTPTTFLVDQRGRIVKRYIGAPDFKALHALIEQLLTQA